MASGKSGIVLVTRPIEQAAEFAEQIRSLGFSPLIQPLLDMEYFPFSFESIEKPAAIILSSRQALQSQNIPSDWQTVPVFCVGEMTEQAARQAGFINTFAGQGDLIDLLHMIMPRVSAGQRILYLRGQDVRHDLTQLLPDYKIQEVITYKAKPVTSLRPDVLDKFGQIDVITLFSARSGAVLRQLIHENGLISYVKNINLLCLSPSVVESMVEMEWKSCVMSDLPHQVSVIEKLKSI